MNYTITYDLEFPFYATVYFKSSIKNCYYLCRIQDDGALYIQSAHPLEQSYINILDIPDFKIMLDIIEKIRPEILEKLAAMAAGQEQETD